MSFEVHQEPDSLPRTKLLVVFAAAVVVTVLALVYAWALMVRSSPERPASRRPAEAPRQIATVEQTPIRETARGWDERRDAREALTRFRWVDQDAGVAEIPVDVAMDVVARREAERGGAR